MTGTPGRTARVSGMTRDLKEAAGKLLARGIRIAYEASDGWARGPKDSNPMSLDPIWRIGGGCMGGRSRVLP